MRLASRRSGQLHKFDQVDVDEGARIAAGQEVRTIRIGIVDDHPVFRLGLKRALERESDFDIAWELSSAHNIDAMVRRTPVDVILMDIYMGSGKDGIAATKDVMERWPGIRVVVISASVDERSVLASARAGAHGFLPKSMPVPDMVKSIRRLAADDTRRRQTGDVPIERRRSSRSKSAPLVSKVSARIGGLSPRQR